MFPLQVSKPFTAFFSFFVLVISTTISANAQLKADFTIDKNAGCSPLTVSFTNATTGSSAAATYKWDFGNGNTSTLVNPGATYVTEKTYTVTLTVTDGTTNSTQTKQVIVYKKPVVDFSAAPVKGCLPLPVNFTSSSTAGDGTIASYFWDFGDGNTQQGTSLQQVSHTYNFAQNASVGLTITNSYGCYATTTKPAAQILQAISASFTVDKKVLCTVGDVAVFTNTSTGPGTLSYLWDFGDGTTSTDQSPSHVFAKQGTFNVKLTVSNTDGCSNTSAATVIQVAGFTVDFDVPQPVCRAATVTFIDKSTTGWTNEIWTIDGNPYYTYNPGYSYWFYTSGTHTVQLTATYGTCTQSSAIKTITVNDIPTPAPFVVTIPAFCTPPVNVQFKDTTAGAVAWTWYFNAYVDQSTASTQAPSHTYTGQGSFYVSLTVKNAAGCTASEIQPISINQTNVFIYLLSGTTIGCDSVPTIFAANAADQIATYKWDFGDGSTSTDPQPHHTFTKAGDFTITLSYTTKNGCNATTNFSSIHVSKKPNVDFYASPGTTICGNTPVTFYATGDGGGMYQWDFGDGNNNWYLTPDYTDAIHQYYKDSVYTVTLIVKDYYYGVCSDTVTKVNYIKVLPPFPKINGATNTCDGTRGLVTFKDTSYKVQTWSWNFGDGSSSLSYSMAQSPITHLYTKTGMYKVVLTATYDQCTVKDSTTVYVLLKQKPVLSASVNNVCSSGPLTINLSNMETNPAPYPYFWYGNYYYLANMQYGDSTNYAAVPFQNVVWQNSTNWTANNLDVTKKDLRIISTSEYFGCNDTSNFIPLKIKGPVAGYQIISNNNCY
ncbi:MAG: PKD domain-containing protein, partial [Bacteroidetes bacterium]|nr:PKD domain-containing protein [Bacteroidota bacterium]